MIRVLIVCLGLLPTCLTATDIMVVDTNLADAHPNRPHVKRKSPETDSAIKANLFSAPKKQPNTGLQFTLPPERTFEEIFGSVCRYIELGHELGKARRTRTAYRMFEKLTADENQWENLARQLRAYRWPSQKTWREVVGGHIFFPRAVFDWEEELIEKHKLTLMSTVWSHAIAAIYHHPIGKCYLVKTLEDWVEWESRPDFYKTLYQEAFGDLVRCEDNSDACYVIAQNYDKGPSYLSDTYVKEDDDDCSAGLKWYSKGTDLKNRFLVLRAQLRENWKTMDDPTRAEQYLKFAREGHLKAYMLAFNALQLDEVMRESVLHEALQQGYSSILYYVGDFYESAGNQEKAREYYERAGDAGVSCGYLELGMQYLGVLVKLRDAEEKFTHLSDQEVDEIFKWCRKAGEANNPDGWEYILDVCSKLLRYESRSVRQLIDHLLAAIEGGMKLGSRRAYSAGYFYLGDTKEGSAAKKKYTKWLERYGEGPGLNTALELQRYVAQTRADS